MLVDGRRWVRGSSASGVSGAVDLNTIPNNAIKSVEISLDGSPVTFQMAVRWSTETGEGGPGRAGSEFLGTPEEVVNWLEGKG